jgi:lysophospholipase L1-like esterase
MKKQMRVLAIVVASLLSPLWAQPWETLPADPYFATYKPLKAPMPEGLLLQPGDRLAICGDSITEQKMYSRLMEDYLTVCAPELNVTVRQYGWSGERASGFLARMTNDCLRFEPSIATTCYGMNDHEYHAYEERVGQTYREKSTAIIEAFKANGVRVIQGSPGCVGKVPGWVKTAGGSVEELNESLCRLRNIGIEIAKKEGVGYADVFWPMVTAGVQARAQYGTNYAISGKDGVHPNWAGHTVMAYAFLKALGLKGDIGTFNVDLKRNTMKASAGHEVLAAKDGEFQVKSSRYVFCPCVEAGEGNGSYPVCDKDDPTQDSSIRSGMTLVPFNRELNRLVLIARHGNARNYLVTWGGQTKQFTAKQLAEGVNLAEEFPCNPFCAAFAKVDAAVKAKQAYETTQIKQRLHSREAKTDVASVVAETEKEREPLEKAVHAAFVPVTHTLKVTVSTER